MPAAPPQCATTEDSRAAVFSASDVAAELRHLRGEIETLTRRLPDAAPRDCPTLAELVPRLEAHAKARRRKPRGIETTQDILRLHLLPRFGGRRLDAITAQDIEALKGELRLSAKSINNVLTVLRSALRTAARWRLLKEVPPVELLPVDKPEMAFYDFEEFARLAAAAEGLGPRVAALVLLGGEAGLRRGEMMALEWRDVDWKRAVLRIRRSYSRGHLTKPKSGKAREVPMTSRVSAALAALRGSRRGLVFVKDDGTRATVWALTHWLAEAQREAGLRDNGALHVLRHTFCSHLAMRGAPLLAIKELAGHATIETTMGYMHLAPSEARRAISLLDVPAKIGQGENSS